MSRTTVIKHSLDKSDGKKKKSKSEQIKKIRIFSQPSRPQFIFRANNSVIQTDAINHVNSNLTLRARESLAAKLSMNEARQKRFTDAGIRVDDDLLASKEKRRAAIVDDRSIT